MVRRVLALTLLLSLLACGGGGGSGVTTDAGGTTPPPSPVQQRGAIVVRQVLARAIPTEVSEIRATVFDANGRTVHGPTSHGRAGEFRLDDVPTTGVTLNLLYLEGATVIGVGNVSVTVRAGETTVVEDPPFEDVAAALRSLRITPAMSTLAAGTAVQLSAFATYSDGTQLDVSDTSVWRSLSPEVTRVTNAGLVTALSQGDSEVEVVFGPLSARAEIAVTAAVPVSVSVTPSRLRLADGTSGNLRAFATFSDGTQQEITETAEWSTGIESIGSVNSAGQVLAEAPGQTSVTATFRGISASAELEVTAATPVSLAVSPRNLTIPVGLTHAFEATVTLSDGTSQKVTGQTHWSVVDTGIAAIDGSGLAVGRGVGSTTVEAVYGTLRAEAELQISSATLAGLELRPPSLSLADGTRGAVQVFGLYSDGSELDITIHAAWSSSSVASVDSDGAVQTLSVGSDSLRATVGDFSASFGVTVTNASLASIEVAPASTKLPAGASQVYTATGVYSNGARQLLGTEVVWSTQDTTVAQVDPLGRLLGQSVGTTTVLATLGTVSGTATVEVTDAVPVALAVEPAAVTMGFDAVQLTANLTYSDGSYVDVTSQVTWSSIGVASVSARGLASSSRHFTFVTGVNDFVGMLRPYEGNATVTATLDDFSAVSEIVVSLPDALDGLLIHYRDAILTPGTTQRLAAETYNSPKRDLNTSIEWSSDNSHVVSTGDGVFEVSPDIAHGTSALVRGVFANRQSFLTSLHFNRFLFVSTATSSNVGALQVTEDGQLSLINSRSSEGGFPRDLSMHPSGRYVYSANYNGNTVTRFVVSTSGSLSEGQTFGTARQASSVTMLPHSDTLLVAGIDGVTSFPSRPQMISPGPPGPGNLVISRPAHSLTLAPDGRLLYMLDNSNRLLVYSLGPVAPSLVSSQTLTYTALATSTDGSFLYATSNARGNVETFRVETTGALTSVGAAATGQYPRGIAVHPTKKVAYVANFDSNSIGIYDIGSDGALTLRSTLALGTSPRTVKLDPGGKFLYTALPNANQVASYGIAADGSLTLIDTESVPGQPFDLATNP